MSVLDDWCVSLSAHVFFINLQAKQSRRLWWVKERRRREPAGSQRFLRSLLTMRSASEGMRTDSCASTCLTQYKGSLQQAQAAVWSKHAFGCLSNLRSSMSHPAGGGCPTNPPRRANLRGWAARDQEWSTFHAHVTMSELEPANMARCHACYSECIHEDNASTRAYQWCCTMHADTSCTQTWAPIKWYFPHAVRCRSNFKHGLWNTSHSRFWVHSRRMNYGRKMRTKATFCRERWGLMQWPCLLRPLPLTNFPPDLRVPLYQASWSLCYAVSVAGISVFINQSNACAGCYFVCA